MVDMVNHPPHYTSHPSGVEAIEICRHMSFNVGNVIKYLWRAGLKEAGTLETVTRRKHLEDLRKAQFYLNDEIKKLEKLWENPPVEATGLSAPTARTRD